MSRTLTAVITAAALGGLGACSRTPRPPHKDRLAARPAGHKPGSGPGEPSSAKPPPADAAKPATKPPPPPFAATPTAPPPKLSVSPHFSVGRSDAFALPVARKPAHIRLSPTVAGGGRVTSLRKVFGGELVALAIRADGGWAGRWVAPVLSAGSASFDVRFPAGGSHVLWAVFQPEGREIAKVPTFFSVTGKPGKPAADQLDNLRTYRGGQGIEVALQLAVEVPVCQPAEVASIWTRRSKPLALTPLGSAAVQYVAVDASGALLVLGRSRPDPEPPGAADKGSRAEFRFPAPGRFTVWAFADSGRRTYSASFGVRVTGKPPKGGCKP